ncbi:MAG: lysozyme inhibitor LprI family protein [Methylococcales bacterium]|nr:lysozyme inhibitor LprI family protein [Methylococcales bacterium]
MNIGEVSFYTGILLFFIGIIGGGIDVKEVKIPQITGLPRYMCFIGSVLFIILGLYLKKEITDTAISNAFNNAASINTPATNPADVPATTPPVADQQPVVTNEPPVDAPAENAEADKAIAAKHQALIQLDAANKRINAVWNGTSQDIRDVLLPEQNQWLAQRDNDCSLQAASEQPIDKVMQEAAKLNCMTTMSDQRTDALKQDITETAASVATNDDQITDSNPSEAEASRNQAQVRLDEANKRINVVWNAATQDIKAALLPEQKQWLQQRKEDCLLKAANEQPDDKMMQEAFKLNCMATMTDPRTEELKEKIAAMTHK